MPTLILTLPEMASSGGLAREALSSHWEVLRLRASGVNAGLRSRADVAIYGDWRDVTTLCHVLDRVPLVTSRDFLADLPAEYRKRDVRLLRLRDAFGITERSFFKPSDSKDFPARVYLSGKDLEATVAAADRGVSADSLILAAEPVRWRIEFRLFVLDRHVRAGSPYCRDGAFMTSQTGFRANDEEVNQALALASNVLQDSRVSLPPAVTLDVGLLDGRGWAIVETNPPPSSGTYGARLDRLLPVLLRSTVSRYRMTREEATWASFGFAMSRES